MEDYSPVCQMRKGDELELVDLSQHGGGKKGDSVVSGE